MSASTDATQKELLDLLTFNEAKNFMELLQDSRGFLPNILGLSSQKCFECLTDFAKTATLRKEISKETEPQTPFDRYKKEKALSALQ